MSGINATTLPHPGGVPRALQGALTEWVARVVADREMQASVDGKWAKQSAGAGHPPGKPSLQSMR